MNTFERKAHEARKQQLLQTAIKARLLADDHRAGRNVKWHHELPETSQGDLAAAAAGRLGLSTDMRGICGRALEDWESAIRERADRETLARDVARDADGHS